MRFHIPRANVVDMGHGHYFLVVGTVIVATSSDPCHDPALIYPSTDEFDASFRYRPKWTKDRMDRAAKLINAHPLSL